ncbi:MAG: type II toxin-antitoxin system HicB family antitoxin [Waterburya sp.]
MNEPYSIIIQWSEKDNCFVATLPEWGNYNTHGNSYEEALDKAQEVLTSLIKLSVSQGKVLPKPKTFQIVSTAP